MLANRVADLPCITAIFVCVFNAPQDAKRCLVVYAQAIRTHEKWPMAEMSVACVWPKAFYAKVIAVDVDPELTAKVA